MRPRVAILADSDRIEQTLINLVDNAVKFSPPGSTVSIHTEAVGSFVEFVVRDTAAAFLRTS